MQVNKCYKDKLKYLINYNIVVHKIVFIVGSSSCDPPGPMRGGERCGDWSQMEISEIATLPGENGQLVSLTNLVEIIFLEK